MKSWIFKLIVFVNVILYFVLMATWIAIPDELTLNISTTAFNLSLTGLLLFLKRGYWKGFYTSSYFKNATSNALTVFLVFALLGLMNYLTFKNPKQVDLTDNKNNTLSQQSLDILASLEGAVEATIFSTPSDADRYRLLLNLYRYKKNDLNINLIDPTLRPDLVKIYGIEKTGTILLEYGEKKQLVLETTELAITNALIRLSREEAPSAFFLIGHGEKSLRDETPEGFSSLKTLLENSTYNIEEVDLRQRGPIPEEIDLVVLWGPTNDLMDQELRFLDSFLARGGGILVALDPDLNKVTAPGLRSFLKKHGVSVANNFVIDVESHITGSNGTVPLVARFNAEHPVTKNMREKIFLPIASSVETTFPQSWYLLESTPFPGSWAESDPDEIIEGRISFVEGRDLVGPVPLGAALERENGSKIVAFGNSSFISNKYSKFSSNFLLFLNTLAWQLDADRLISLEGPSIKEENPVFIGAPQLGIIFYFSVLFAPLALILTGLILYRRRIRL